MKERKLFYLSHIILFLCVWAPVAFAGKGPGPVLKRPMKDWDNKFLILKTNFIQDGISDANLSIEKSLGGSFSFELKLQYQYWNKYPNPYEFFTGTSYSGRGFGFHGMIRKYGFLGDRSFFFSAGGYYKNKYQNMVHYNENDGGCYTFDGVFYKYAAKFLAGMQFRIFKGKGILEFYLGGGIGKRVERGTLYQDADCEWYFETPTVPHYYDGLALPLFLGFNIGLDAQN